MSRARVGGLWIVVLAALLAAPTTGRCQIANGGAVTDPLATFKVGHWIKLEAAAQGASPAPCSAVKLLTGDFLDDDWSLRGTVKTVDSAKREFTIGDCRVQITENTTYDSPQKGFKAFTDLRPGSFVEIEGMFLKSRAFLAAEVDDESDELARQPRMKDQVVLVGRVERVDLRKRVISVMGMDFQVTAKTQIRTVIR